MMPATVRFFGAVVWTCAAAWLCGASLPAAQAPPAAPATGIPALIAQLADRQTERAATIRLRALGPPAAAALANGLTADPFRDRDHGNHSPTMRALESFGEAAVAAVNQLLTDERLQSEADEDQRTVLTAVYVLAEIGGVATVPPLVRAAVTARDREARASALRAVAWPSFYLESSDQNRPNRPLQFCLMAAPFIAHPCPLDDREPRIEAAVRPFLDRILEHLRTETDPRVRLAAAQLLARRGEGGARRVGEDALIELLATPVRGEAIASLGLLGVERARDAIHTAGAADDYGIRRETIAALQRLKDARWVDLTVALLRTPTGPLRKIDVGGGFYVEGSDVTARRWSVGFAGRSRDLSFVPTLIDMLGDRNWSRGPTVTTRGSERTETPHTFAEDAQAALRSLTFQDLGPDPQAWRAWWDDNKDRDWRSHLSRYVDQTLPKLPNAEPWIMNQWMEAVADADDPAVVPLVTAYVRHPRFDPSWVGPNTFRGGGGTPPIVLLLLHLSSQGSTEARQLLYACADAREYPLGIDCARMVALFDRARALASLGAKATRPYRYWVGHALVELGDPQGIPILIAELSSAERAARSLAFRDLALYTQQDIPFQADGPEEARKASAAAWQRWWEEANAPFRFDLAAIRAAASCCRR